MADDEDVVLTTAAVHVVALLLLHQENVVKDVDRVLDASVWRSINFKVLTSVQSVHAGGSV